MLEGNYILYFEQISKKISPDRIFTDKASTLAFGTDASFYRLIPKIVIQSKSIEEISFLLEEANKLNLPVTFRAAGTSLSGQAISDSILILTSKYWTNHEVIENGNRIKLQPGVIGARANVLLKPYGRKIGPDPASINSAMIGGIAANNASGMCCGTAQNSYKTLESLKIIFYDGFLLDTNNLESIENFKKHHATIYNEVVQIIKETQNNQKLVERIHHKYKMKNTTGYSLNALVDYTNPIDVINHLMIGSEGTLGMIAEITYNTVEDHPYKASALMIFENIEMACNVVSILKSAPVAAVELMDRASLRSVEKMEGVPNYLPTLSAGASAVLVETVAPDMLQLKLQIAEIEKSIKHIQPELPFKFTTDATLYNQYWKIRKGLFPTVGAIRKIGTTVIIEDITFPVHRLAAGTLDLQDLFKKYHYNEAVIFGHALEGNIHFVFTQDFGKASEIKRYEDFMDELSVLVVDKYDGALKSEHGTGRNMAPFVEKEWGAEAYDLMKKIKLIFDPKGIINPGVIINEDKKVHLKNLKPLPKADDQIDKCIECGFCEPFCVSHNLGFSPRQRIVLHREMSRLDAKGNSKEARELEKSFEYGFDSMCATDGLCMLACPVKIDTGDYVKRIRAKKHSGNKIAKMVANNLSLTLKGIRVGLTVSHAISNIIGDNAYNKVVGASTSILGQKMEWNEYTPKAANFKIEKQTDLKPHALKVVYFSSCINRMIGASNSYGDEDTVFNKTVKILNKANCEIIFPEDLENLCCGLAFKSQGFAESAHIASDKLFQSLLKASNKGAYPILCDMSPCSLQMKESMKDSALNLYDLPNFTTTFLLDRLEFNPVNKEVAVFSVCSLKKMGIDEDLYAIAKLCSSKVYTPKTNCCGFAGNKGFNFPELNEHGLRTLDEQIPENVTEGYATSRTCEIGLSKHSKADFKSIVNLIDLATKPKINI
ncbi:FAD-binding and (Fe-S)-binding domain-containing protein [Lutibacter sp.]|uniref:FAD-binding and (Fe-S)-binding domain-containing protein n=1 Tax=Lutibacter sp. TaxID=1925666 RepID=UPI003563EBCE